MNRMEIRQAGDRKERSEVPVIHVTHTLMRAHILKKIRNTVPGNGLLQLILIVLFSDLHYSFVHTSFLHLPCPTDTILSTPRRL